ncbi:nucleolin-like isoform X3 [Pomacea canaliculata]|uniref:nucleolin-like isoform X3 n=1 Tax=Pomacea canaliculata TaxID=400727 RepID=UPI000D734E59|nr:nucleolin-like isoform X3 [Pomacea canaliculata]
MADAKSTLARDGTMDVTAKEGEQLLENAGGKPDPDAQTRGQQRKIDEIKSETVPESPAKKAKLTKESTMAATAKEGKELLGKEKLGDTRQETAKQNANKAAPKRGVTIAKTVEEAKFMLEGKEIDVNEGRRTRSQSKPASTTPPAKPTVKRGGTMQKTAKEGKEFVKRGKGKARGKSAATTDDSGDKHDDDDEEEESPKECEKAAE